MPSSRPTSISVFGILNITLGIIGIYIPLGAIFLQAILNAQPKLESNSVQPVLSTWDTFSIVVGFLASVALIFIGVGMLSLKPLSRKACIFYSFYSVFHFLLDFVHDVLGPENQVNEPIFVVILDIVISFLYPIILWVFMARPSVVEVFEHPDKSLIDTFD